MDNKQRIDQRGDWEKALSSRLRDYEPSAPQLAPLKLSKQRPKTFNSRLLIGVASFAAVLIFIAFLFIGKHSLEDDIRSAVLLPKTSIAGKVEKRDDNLLLDSKLNVLSRQQYDKLNREEEYEVAISNENSSHNLNTENRETVSEQNDIVETAIVEEKNNVNNDSPSASPSHLDNKTKLSFQKSKRPLKLSFFTSGTTLSAIETPSYINDGIIAGAKQYDVYETPMVEVGSTILFPINQRLLIQSGLLYSWYRITLIDDTPLIGESYRLDVHSLGIPLNIQYTFLDATQWRIYGESGLELKIPIASTMRSNMSIQKGDVTTSVGASADMGIEYKISKDLGLYSSFGATYDLLQMKSNLPNADISRCHGKLEVGIRFNINRAINL